MKKNNIAGAPKKGKAVVAVGLAALLSVGLFAGCSDSGKEEEATPSASATALATPAPTTEAPETSAAPAETTIEMSDNGATVTGEGAVAEGNDVTITGGGEYIVTGDTTNGSIIANAPGEDVTITLNGANIANPDGPAILVEDAGNAEVIVADGTENTLQDSAVQDETQPEASASDAAEEDLTTAEAGETESASAETAESEDAAAASAEPEESAAASEESSDADTAEPSAESSESAAASDDAEASASPEAAESEYDAVLYGAVSYTVSGSGALTVNGTVAQGIVGEMDITIDGPTLNVTAVGDGINAAGALEISSGTVLANSSNEAEANSGVNAASDIMVSGGILFSSGAVNPVLAADAQNYLVYDFDETVAEGSTISIRQGEAEVFSMTVGADLQALLYSDAALESGASYDIYVDDEQVGSADVVSAAAADETDATGDTATDDVTATDGASDDATAADEADTAATDEGSKESEDAAA